MKSSIVTRCPVRQMHKQMFWLFSLYANSLSLKVKETNIMYLLRDKMLLISVHNLHFSAGLN